MQTLELVATEEQEEIITCSAKFLILIAGRRWGKTIGVICNHILAKCLERPNVEYLLVAPSMTQVRMPFDLIAGHPNTGAFIRQIDRRYYPLITWFNGSRTHFRTLDQPDLLRGSAYDWIWLDEIQNVDEHTIDTVLLPCLSDRRGHLGMSGQGRGEEHWIYQRFFAPGRNPKNWRRIRSWQFSIAQGLRFQDAAGKEELATLKEVTPPDVWEEEYEGRFVSSGRCVFRSQDIQECIRGDLETSPKMDRNGHPHRYILALDLGRVVDPSGWIILDSTTAQVVHAEVRPFRERHDEAAQKAEALRLKWNDALCIVDKTGYGAGAAPKIDEYVRQYERYVKRLVPFFWSQYTKKRIIDILALAVEQHKVGIPDAARELRRQMGVYEFAKRGETVTCSAPQGDHDDLVSALAMAWHAHRLNMAATGMADLGSLL